MGFQVSALSVDQFSHLFGQDGEVLAQLRGAARYRRRLSGISLSRISAGRRYR